MSENRIRIVTAASLFDGHDAAINIMRRMFQAAGAEVIHLGHNRSADEVVQAAIQEDVHAVALTSYQGGHVEYLKYIRDLLNQRGYAHVRIVAGGGGVILPQEIEELESYGITKVYSPDDGRRLGLEGMIQDAVQRCTFDLLKEASPPKGKVEAGDFQAIARALTQVEAGSAPSVKADTVKQVPVLGITGTGGAGKSSLVDEWILRFREANPDRRVAILSVDPSKRKTGGALLGDRIRMNAIQSPNVFMRSMATRQANLALSKSVLSALEVLKAGSFDLILLETSGIGQSDTEIVDHSDASLYVMTPEYGAASQLEKIDMIDFADFIAINKSDRRGAQDALRDVRKQYQRARKLFDLSPDQTPVFSTIASEFNDRGVSDLYNSTVKLLNERFALDLKALDRSAFEGSHTAFPASRTRYLSEISDEIRAYNHATEQEAKKLDQLQAIRSVKSMRGLDGLSSLEEELLRELDSDFLKRVEHFEEIQKKYEADFFEFKVRGKTLKVKTFTESLSHTQIPRVRVPHLSSYGDRARFLRQENVPGEFPYTAGVFPFKREGEDPTRMFAGEGGPERTNRRFHYLSHQMPAKRLSTAFDSVTLYGADPDLRPDIFGKIGNAGVSVASLDDAKRLYSGFDLCDPKTSVSMTINGPAPMLLAYFFNAAIDQQCEKYILAQGLEQEVEKKIQTLYKGREHLRPQYRGKLPEGHNGLGLRLLGVTGDLVLPQEVYEKLRIEALQAVRGTVQADILKEDQAQNTCIFSTEFALRLMGDVQEAFIQEKVRNFYSVSISGYHIAEAGANPITQLALTLANGLTYVEYYLAKGLKLDDFAPNFSFFFSNGLDPEYSVIGRVARRIWAKAIALKYKGSERSQKLKYHIQTSGRSLHAQEIAFNDVRTTLQALYAIADQCNSLHTNAYDEAITTPTEESVRRAMAIQLIINKELGLTKNENPLQGSYFIEWLTDEVENRVLEEFDRLTERGGVLGAMETMYQRGKIQEESMHYEHLKHTGELPLVGVNTFLSSEGSPTVLPQEVIRSTEDEKKAQIEDRERLHELYRESKLKDQALLRSEALRGANVFTALMEVSKRLTLGQMTDVLFEVGGQYRRNM